LVSFTATPRNENIQLDWQTASEDGFAGFELQRATSRNGNDFQKIAWYAVSGGNSISLKSYSHLDLDVLPGQTYYYRLNQVDLDGTAELSSIVSATLAGKDEGLQLFPNPAANDIIISYKQELINQQVTLKVFDNTGRQVLIQTLDATSLINNGYLMNIESLVNGAYLVSLEDDGVKATARFVRR
jgi:Secretion system C-terminal sorting domain